MIISLPSHFFHRWALKFPFWATFALLILLRGRGAQASSCNPFELFSSGNWLQETLHPGDNFNVTSNGGELDHATECTYLFQSADAQVGDYTDHSGSNPTKYSSQIVGCVVPNFPWNFDSPYDYTYYVSIALEDCDTRTNLLQIPMFAHLSPCSAPQPRLFSATPQQAEMGEIVSLSCRDSSCRTEDVVMTCDFYVKDDDYVHVGSSTHDSPSGGCRIPSESELIASLGGQAGFVQHFHDKDPYIWIGVSVVTPNVEDPEDPSCRSNDLGETLEESDEVDVGNDLIQYFLGGLSGSSGTSAPTDMPTKMPSYCAFELEAVGNWNESTVVPGQTITLQGGTGELEQASDCSFFSKPRASQTG